jgi:ubiquinone/menaquinone biosynthesis C-methylase UbiE
MAGSKRKTEKMSKKSFKFMNFAFKIIDFIYPYIKKRSKTFGIPKDMKVIDYGCGPDRYTVKFAKIVGESGMVYAVDIHEMALDEVNRKIKKLGLNNLETILVKGYNCPLPDKTADITCAIDMFFIIQKPTEFLGELNRLTKEDGILIIDDEHQRRSNAQRKIEESGYWEIFEETKHHFKCRPIKN